MIEGVHLPLSFLAALAVTTVLPWALCERRWARPISATRRWLARHRLAWGFLLLFVLATVPSNVVFVDRTLNHVAANNADLINVLMPPAYLTADEVSGLQWLARHCTFSDVILCSPLIGNHIPAWCPARVYAGHWAETLHYSACIQTVATFFAPGVSPLVRRQVIGETGATYVWWGQYERIIQRSMIDVAQQAIGHQPPFPDPPNRGLPELQPVFSRGEVVIYRVAQLGDRQPPGSG
ncbi:MAG: hypothetical protein H5T86_15265 [Armatimonadetes bacterium]|nr:hypothetical protein [Armatimonadota bacterium]